MGSEFVTLNSWPVSIPKTLGTNQHPFWSISAGSTGGSNCLSSSPCLTYTKTFANVPFLLTASASSNTGVRCRCSHAGSSSMSTFLWGGRLPVKLILPVTIPAVAGSTWKTAAVFFGASAACFGVSAARSGSLLLEQLLQTRQHKAMRQRVRRRLSVISEFLHLTAFHRSEIRETQSDLPVPERTRLTAADLCRGMGLSCRHRRSNRPPLSRFSHCRRACTVRFSPRSSDRVFEKRLCPTPPSSHRTGP